MTDIQSHISFIRSHGWIYAKTMPEVPHYYLVKKKCFDDDRFEAFARYIFEEGIPMKWGKWVRLYMDIGEYRYWSMDPTAESTDLINRELISISKCRPA